MSDDRQTNGSQERELSLFPEHHREAFSKDPRREVVKIQDVKERLMRIVAGLDVCALTKAASVWFA